MKSYKAETNFKSNLSIQLPMAIIVSVAIVIVQDFPWFLVLITPIYMTLLLWGVSQIQNNVTYIISGNNLLVSTTFINKIVDIGTIRKIEKSSNLLATGADRATAPSNKALEIWFNKYNTIKVSPKNESEFIKDLLEINPSIEVII